MKKALRLQSIRLAPGTIADAEPGPIWVQVAEEGAYLGHAAGPFTLDAAAFDQIAKNLRANPSFRADASGLGCARVIAIDFHHASELPPGEVAVHGAPAQGWVLDLRSRVSADGKVCMDALVDWLEPARSYIREGKYQWMSIAVWPDATDPKTGSEIGWYMSSIALTNDPFIQGMVPIAASRGEGTKDSPDIEPARKECTNMKALAKLAELLKIAPSVVLAARDNDPATVAALEHEVIAETKKLTLAAEQGAIDGDFVEAVMKALGTTREEVMTKLVNLLKSASDLDAMKPEYDEMKAQQATHAAEQAQAQVTAAMRYHAIPNEAHAALLYMRTHDPKGFAEKYPLPPAGAEHTAFSLVTERSGRTTIVGGPTVASRAPAMPAGSNLGGAPAHAPAREDGGIVLFRGTPNQVNLASFAGRNDVERAIAYLRSVPGGSHEAFEVIHSRACELVRQHRAN